MKKILALIMVFALAMPLLVGCAGTTVIVGGNCDCGTPNITVECNCTCQGGGTQTQGVLKTGLSISTSFTKDSTFNATAEKDGQVAYDLTIAAVVVDSNGVIVSCVIDSVPATVKFNTSGAITSDLNMSIPTKNELGENYGMVAWGGAKYEWDVQVAAVAQYAVGKTVDQLKTGDINMTTGKANDGTDLASSATIYLAGYVYAIEAAVNNAKALGAQAGDTLVLSTMNNVKSSVNATAAKAGTIQLDSDIVALTKRGETVTSCYLDAVQAKVSVDATGKITLPEKVETKNELGDAYGMVAWGGAKYDWNVQAASFASYITGKTASEIAGISVTESTKPADGTDLSSSVTIAIGGFQALIAKAMA